MDGAVEEKALARAAPEEEEEEEYFCALPPLLLAAAGNDGRALGASASSVVPCSRCDVAVIAVVVVDRSIESPPPPLPKERGEMNLGASYADAE